jgi:hypothetical protein
VGLGEQREIHAEAAVGGLGAGDGLKDQIDGRAGVERFHLRGDVGQHAALHGDLKALAQGVDHAQQARGDGHVVAGGVDADDRVAGAEQQAVEDGRGNAGCESVGWLGWRRALRRPGRPTVVRKRVTTRIFLRGGDQVLHAHELAYGGGHLRREAGRESGERSGWPRRRAASCAVRPR